MFQWKLAKKYVALHCSNLPSRTSARYILTKYEGSQHCQVYTRSHTWPPPAPLPRSPGAGRAARRRRRGPGGAASRSGGPPPIGTGDPRFCPTKKEIYFQLKFENSYSWQYVILFKFDKVFAVFFWFQRKISSLKFNWNSNYELRKIGKLQGKSESVRVLCYSSSACIHRTGGPKWAA